MRPLAAAFAGLDGSPRPPPERVWPHWMVLRDAKRLVDGYGYVPLIDQIRAQGK